MSAETLALQRAVVAALTADASLAAMLSGVFDGPPARAALPWAGVDCGMESDWSHKTGRGREIRLAISLWTDGRAATELHQLMVQAEAALAQVALGDATMQLVGLVFQRSRVMRAAGEPWLGLLEYRARILTNEGA